MGKPPSSSAWSSPYRLVSIFFFLMLTVFQSMRVVMTGTVRLADPGTNLFLEIFLFHAPFQLLFLFFFLVRESQLTRLLQVLTIMVFAVATTLFVTPDEIGGYLAYLVGVVLAYKYGYFNRRPGLLIAVLLLVDLSVRVAVVLLGYIEAWRAVSQAAIIAAALPIVYWMIKPRSDCARSLNQSSTWYAQTSD